MYRTVYIRRASQGGRAHDSGGTGANLHREARVIDKKAYNHSALVLYCIVIGYIAYSP